MAAMFERPLQFVKRNLVRSSYPHMASQLTGFRVKGMYNPRSLPPSYRAQQMRIRLDAKMSYAMSLELRMLVRTDATSFLPVTGAD